MGKEIIMAELKSDVQAPAVEDLGKGARFAEDELADLEQKAVSEGLAGKKAVADADAGVLEADDAAADEASAEKIRQYMVKKGITDIGKVIDLASDLESKNTKLAQDVQRLSAVTRFPILGEDVAAGDQFGRHVELDDDLEIPENPIELVTDKAKLRAFAQKLEDRAVAKVTQREQGRSLANAKEQVRVKMAENPEEFEKLRPTMLTLSRQYPGANLDQLYDGAKTQYSADRKSLVEEIRRELGLTGVETEKIKAIVGRVRQAPISSGSGVQVTPAVTKEQKEGADLLKAIATSDKY